MSPRSISLICTFLPLFCVHSTLLIAIGFGNLPACIPYWSDCHSISATGRANPEFFVFKGLMLPSAVFMALYWLLLHRWLAMVAPVTGHRLGITAQGLLACVALVVYTVTLGAEGEPYRLARRMGIVFFFVFTSFAHLLLLARLAKTDRSGLGIEGPFSVLYLLCASLVIGGLVSGVLGFLWSGWDDWENAFEWTYSLGMICLFYVVGEMWKATEFKLYLRCKATHDKT